MADNEETPVTGGNTPKPAASESTQTSAKDKSRAASRPVAATTSGKGGNTPRPGGKPAAAVGGPKSSKRGVLIEPGDIFFRKSTTASQSHFRLGYSAIPRNLIDAGVRELSVAYKAS